MTPQRRRNEGGDSVALPITPMLDMSFQLLFFFISTFRLPTGMEGEMALSLPQERGCTCEEPEPYHTPIDLTFAVTIALKADATGLGADGVAALTLLERAGATPLPYDKDLKELRERLVEVERKGGHDQPIKIQGDAKVKWAGVVRVMDACRVAGLNDVSFAQPPDASR